MRLVIDGLADTEACVRACALARRYAKLGDGYDGNGHPHRPEETFLGCDLRADGDPLPREDRLFVLGLAAQARRAIRESRSLGGTPLWLGYSHLAVREGNDPVGRGLSHDWHRDNANPGNEWRDTSAVLLLSNPEEVEGGAFLWRNDGALPPTAVEPARGRLIAFQGRDEHGVGPVLRGRRVALALWFCAAAQPPAHVLNYHNATLGDL